MEACLNPTAQNRFEPQPEPEGLILTPDQLERYLEELARRGRTPGTLISYRHNLLRLYDALPDHKTLLPGDLDRFQREGSRTISRENSILLSCVPWFSYTDVSFHPKSSQMFLRPMFVWGKYQEQGEEAVLPFTLQVHHAAADGYHCHLLLSDLEELLNRPEQFFL